MYHERDSTRQNDRLRQGETESEVCGQSAKQPAMQSCIQTARQTTCPVTVHLPGERGQRPSPVSVHFIETLKRNNYWAGASGGLCFWLRNRHYSVVTGGPVLSVWRSILHRDQTYFVSILWAENSQTEKLFWFVDLKYFTRKLRTYKNTCVIPL